MQRADAGGASAILAADGSRATVDVSCSAIHRALRRASHDPRREPDEVLPRLCSAGWVSAVDDVSFDAQPGEIFGLLGPNGAGKTTTMRILCTVLQADRRHGHAWPATTSSRRPSQVRQHIGFMSANTAIYDRMTAWELVEYFGRLYGLAERAAARADGGGLRLAADERLPRRARGEDVAPA